MVCTECKKHITRNSEFCKHCGAKAEKAKKKDASLITAEEPQKAKLKIKKKKSKNTENKKAVKKTEKSSLLFREVEVTEEEADTGAERVLEFDGAVEPLHIIFPQLVCTGQLFMVKKYKFLDEEGKKYKRNILIRVNIA